GTPASSGGSENLRLMMFGSLACIQHEIHRLHLKNYAEPNDWSRPLPTQQPDEVMVILTKRCHRA
ncbi:hypothetical protein, partial [Almyronema epifaneia]